MKNLITFVLIGVFLLSSCSKKTETKETKLEEAKVTTLQDNVSYVTAKILEVDRESDTAYKLKILILESNSDESLPNFAVVNDEIFVKPAFILNEAGVIDSTDSRNQNLIELSKTQRGEVVKLILKRSLNEGWLIINQSK
ncbi:MAG: hypothetical protein ACK4G1_05315 [Ignavibacteria bacterium]